MRRASTLGLSDCLRGSGQRPFLTGHSSVGKKRLKNEQRVPQGLRAEAPGPGQKPYAHVHLRPPTWLRKGGHERFLPFELIALSPLDLVLNATGKSLGERMVQVALGR